MSTERPDVAAAASSAALSRAGRALLALALEVEERVVDADGQADQQHDHADVLVERDSWLGTPSRPIVANTAVEREQQRQARGDERAEGDHEDHERDRQREQAGLLEVVDERLVELLARR